MTKFKKNDIVFYYGIVEQEQYNDRIFLVRILSSLKKRTQYKVELINPCYDDDKKNIKIVSSNKLYNTDELKDRLRTTCIKKISGSISDLEKQINYINRLEYVYYEEER